MEKRHHYVPRFLLRRFSQAADAENPPIFQLDKATGRIVTVGVNDAAVIRHWNTLNNPPDGFSRTGLEAYLSLWEGVASVEINTLCQGLHIDEPGRNTLAVFLWLQRMRTPLGRAHLDFVQQEVERGRLRSVLADDDVFARFADSLSEDRDEAYAMRSELLQVIDDEGARVEITIPHDRNVAAPFVGYLEGGALVSFKTSWSVAHVRAAASELVISDCALTFNDPKRGGQGALGWLESPSVQGCLPLGPKHALIMVPGAPRLTFDSLGARMARELNLRTYAWSQRWIYGRSEETLRALSDLGQRSPQLIELRAPPAPQFLRNTVHGPVVVTGPRIATWRQDSREAAST